MPYVGVVCGVNCTDAFCCLVHVSVLLADLPEGLCQVNVCKWTCEHCHL